MTLQAKTRRIQKLTLRPASHLYSVPRSVIDTMHRADQELIASGAAQRALKVGDRAPLFTLKDTESNQDFIVCTACGWSTGRQFFNRGVWCPICNMELQALEAARPEFEGSGPS